MAVPGSGFAGFGVTVVDSGDWVSLGATLVDVELATSVLVLEQATANITGRIPNAGAARLAIAPALILRCLPAISNSPLLIMSTYGTVTVPDAPL
ncbi:hypothetical protein ACFWPX_24015 [Nocardia sp. NPDC058518]|uniref:hypothetical protein n=1 Tax=Nocardia sp. NPDC058518 TaxID=3346534 RepID=UPI00365A068B